jgi:hypothetical protein
MSYLPEAGKDFECTIVGWADGSPTDKIRVPTIETPLHTDLVLLHCTSRFDMDHFPVPRKFHNPQNDTAAPTVSEEVHMLAYNGLPRPGEEVHLYPNTSKKDILSAYHNLYPDSLSWAHGPSVPERYDADTVFYRISTSCGAPGAGIFDSEGKLIGSFLSS